MTQPEGFEKGRGYFASDSFKGVTDSPQYKKVLEQYILREEGLFRGANLLVNSVNITTFEYPSAFYYATIEQAAAIATLEAASYELAYPHTLIEAPQFPDLYRFLRTLELFHRIPRGGDTLMVGSGTTIPEYLAQYIAPPDFSLVQNFAEEKGEYPLISKLAAFNDNPNNFSMEPVRLLDGEATAIEPTPNALTQIGVVNTHYQVPASRIVVKPYTIGAVTDAGEIPSGLERVLWHRVDPLGFTYPKSPDVDFNFVEEMLATFYKSLNNGGDIIITVGSGNQWDANNQRDKFIAEVREPVQRVGFKILPDIPTFFTEDPFRILFGHPTSGIVGAIVAQK